MKQIRWDLQKSKELKARRGAGFEDLIWGKLIAIKAHPSRSHQNIMLFEYKRYIWVVPYVTNGDEMFLKTLYPSREYTKMFKRGEAT